MNKIRFLPCVLAVSMLLCFYGCVSSSAEAGASAEVSTIGSEQSADSISPESSSSLPVSDMFTSRDLEAEYKESSCVPIKLNGDSIACDSESVQITGTTAVISGEGSYLLSGTLNNGRIVVNAGKKDKVRLILAGAAITSESSAPLYILQADKVFLTLAPDTENSLSNGGGFVAVDGNNIDAALFSKQDLTLNGSGRLTVNSPFGHGIVSKDDLVFTGGSVTVNAASHGLQANDSVRVTDASLTIAAGKDGIHAENADDESLGFLYIAGGAFDISAEGDGISAGAALRIDGGEFTIVSGGGSAKAVKQSSDSWGHFTEGSHGPFFHKTTDDSGTSTKGIKAAGDILINGGSFSLDAADDAVHSNASIFLNGGTFEIATGDDGFHADETLAVTAGTVHISESYEGLEALHLEISGGDITLTATDDGLNAAGGADSSGFGGPRGGDRFGGHGGKGSGQFGGPGGGVGGASSSSNGSIVISGGNLYINASGDGIDANGTLEISGGFITVVGPAQGDTATLDYDVSGVITGGTFIGTGAAGMAQTFSDSEQGVLAVRTGNQPAGTLIRLQDKNGSELFSYAPELSFAVVILSSPELVKGEGYTLTVGSVSGEFQAG